MELKIGMYVRTINGKIWIIKSQQAISGHRKDIINASYNIIDLIEVGDYVNSMRVSELLKRGKKETKYIRFMADSDYEFSTELKEEEIETILTKEMFEQMEYKLD